MNSVRRQGFIAARRRMAGLSLIEMMIALIMALIVAAGIVSVFASTSSSNKVQQQMATLQEEGRFAIHSLRTDLADANGTYCSNTGGNAGGTTSGLFLDSLRSPTVYSKSNMAPASATTTFFPDNTVALADPSEPYSLPSSIFMRGYDCGTTDPCKPTGLDGLAPDIPAMGTAAGDRVKGTDVLTVRYLRPGSGWAIVASGSSSGGSTITPVSATTTAVASVTISPLTGEPPAADFKGTLMMLATCSNAQVYAVTNNGSGVLKPTGTNYTQPQDISLGRTTAPRVFDFSNDFQTITYFLRVVCANGAASCAGGPTTGELVRRVNGTNQPLVRGVERLDFLYGIIDANGKTQFLTADKVDTRNAGTISCPPGVPIDGGMGDAGCLWRAVKTVEVHILMDGQAPLYTLTPDEMKYIYSPDGSAGGVTPAAPGVHPIKPDADQGFPKELMRREFTTLVSLRNFNP